MWKNQPLNKDASAGKARKKAGFIPALDRDRQSFAVLDLCAANLKMSAGGVPSHIKMGQRITRITRMQPILSE
jgi:hypothetical protein